MSYAWHREPMTTVESTQLIAHRSSGSHDGQELGVAKTKPLQ